MRIKQDYIREGIRHVERGFEEGGKELCCFIKGGFPKLCV